MLLSKIATAMIELQQAEDISVKAIQTILCLAPESTAQLSQFISPSIQAQLANPYDHSSSSFDSYQVVAEGPGTNSDILIPFVRSRKEACKPSYKIH